jgi:hypothetical protein
MDDIQQNLIPFELTHTLLCWEVGTKLLHRISTQLHYEMETCSYTSKYSFFTHILLYVQTFIFYELKLCLNALDLGGWSPYSKILKQGFEYPGKQKNLLNMDL